MEEEDHHHDDHHDHHNQATESTTERETHNTDNDNEHVYTSISIHETPNDESAVSLPPLPEYNDSALNADNDDSLSLLHHPSSDLDYAHRRDNQTILDEKEMQQKLMDIESSFLPEPSTIGVAPENANAGADDTYLVGIGEERSREEREERGSFNDIDVRFGGYGDNSIGDLHGHANEEDEEFNDLDATPGPRNRQRNYENTSTLETLTSSPTAAAAERTVSRVLSTASKNIIHNSSSNSREGPPSLTPKKSRRNLSPTPSDSRPSRDAFIENEDDSKLSRTPSERRRSRPRYLTSRQSSHRFSMSSVNSANTDTTTSDATLGADFALQSGGAVPGSANKSRTDLSRSISLGSMASGVSGVSEENVFDKRVASGATDGGLHTLDEEDSGSVPPTHDLEDNVPMTPKAAPRDVPLPTDTAIAARVEDIQVPGTFARQFREKFSTSMSPEKRTAGAPTPAFGRSGRSLTLKEQSSTIDRLSKENFDLKMRIHFLNEALNRRSEEGIKEMISENVELKSDKLKLQKDNQGMKRTVRDLEKRLKDRQAGKDSANQGGETDDEAATEEEIVFLRERIETYEVEMERLRSEVFVGENEKRRLAEVVRSMGDSRPTGSETGAREERVSYSFF
jgi:hypothetical protein